MSRRRQESIADDILNDTWEILLATPWWTCPIIAVFFYAVFAYLIPAVLSSSEVTRMFTPLSRQVAAPLAGGGVLLMGVFAQIVKLSRRRLPLRPAHRGTLEALTWQQFEQLVGAVYGRQGYRVVETGSRGSDGGVDLILHGNGEKVLVQCKQWRSFKVGVKNLREFHGVLMSRNTTANRGIFVTMGAFTQEASRFAEENSIELVDGDGLLGMMRAIQGNPAVASSLEKTVTSGEVRPQPVPVSATVAPACPLCGRSMFLRTARRGVHSGSQFWGCTGYPACKGTRPYEAEG